MHNINNYYTVRCQSTEKCYLLNLVFACKIPLFRSKMYDLQREKKYYWTLRKGLSASHRKKGSRIWEVSLQKVYFLKAKLMCDSFNCISMRMHRALNNSKMNINRLFEANIDQKYELVLNTHSSISDSLDLFA
jgi:hypothetical protein